MTETLPGFILTRQWLDRDDGQQLVFWLATDSGPLSVTVDQQPSVFFVRQADLIEVEKALKDIQRWRHEPVELLTFYQSEAVQACYFRHQRDLNFARSRLEKLEISVFEGDLRPTDRYLMERFVTGATLVQGEVERQGRFLCAHNPRLGGADYSPSLRCVSIDIETSFTEHIIYSIAVYAEDEQRVFMVSSDPVSAQCEVESLPDERSLLKRFFDWFAVYDPDVVIGWSVVSFDLRFIADRCEALGLRCTLGRDGQVVRWRKSIRGPLRHFALVPGRVVLDGIELLRTATYHFESFALDFVARQMLGEGKIVDDVDARAVEIQEMYGSNRSALADYNLNDCRLVWDIFASESLIDFAIERSKLTGLDLDRAGGSVAAFDFLYLPRLHREGFVAPMRASGDVEASPGGFVLNSTAGLYDDVVVLDFKSLYPSIIRTFHVDPLAMITAEEGDIEGFRGACFSRRRALLPRIIRNLWEARDVAKRQGRSAMSRAIKIIMNSFYGVLGTPACRFFDARLASSITMRGHEILQQTRDFIEDRGLPVIYGDTDSVFVHFSDVDDVPGAASELTDDLNGWWRDRLMSEFGVESFLEVEYETHYRKFLMPKIRGSETGSKKRYAGLVVEGGRQHLVFKGLETVRSDWSALAREFQQELYRLVFLDLPFEAYVREVVSSVRGGLRDDQLLLRRRMRRPIGDYVSNVPPHVRAARKAVEMRQQRGLPALPDGGGWVEYLITVNGPEPRQYVESPIDYEFYVSRQLAPVADAILSFKASSLAEIIDPQMVLF
ncbi:MAG: DNA polymerase II [Proteobacteria bacterium]|nr:DNA polymerase II [Pseudomonadota bacterium]MDA1300298.1 DNA polymerase II [Pseudomonadota bacterium]